MNFLFTVFLFIFFLSTLGPIYLNLPLFINTTWGIMKLLALFLLFASLWRSIKRGQLEIVKNPLFIPILLYFIAMAASLLAAQNLEAGISDLGTIAFGLLFFYLAFSFFSSKKQLYWFFATVLFSAVLVSLIGFVAFLAPGFYKGVAKNFVHEASFRLYLFNRERGRIFPLWDIELMIPFFLFLIFQKDKILKAFGSIGGGLVSLMVFLTNFRYRFVAFVFGIIAYPFLNKRLLKFLPFLILLIAVFGTYLFWSERVLGVTMITRFFLEDPQADLLPLQARLEMAWQSLEMFISSPLLGVGLGNYFDNFSLRVGYAGPPLYYFGLPHEAFLVLVFENYKGPHNLFLSTLAETGIVGFIALLFLLKSLLNQDILLFKRVKSIQSRQIASVLIVSSWATILAAQFININTSLGPLIFFWTTRGIIAAIWQKKIL